jgi:hypothetical protein
VRGLIDATLEHGLGNGRVESVKAKIRPIQQRANAAARAEADGFGQPTSSRAPARRIRPSAVNDGVPVARSW